jgi:PTH1 family peptidyl-tRNA hydrolase
LILVKPLSYMNDSGTPLRRVAAWWKVPPADLLVVSDDLDLPFGRLRMRRSGGSGGHNGLKSVIAHFGEDFPRLRVGIGRSGEDAIDHVLSTFDPAEEGLLGAIVAAAAEGVLCWLDEGPGAAMNLVNGWEPSPEGGAPHLRTT